MSWGERTENNLLTLSFVSEMFPGSRLSNTTTTRKTQTKRNNKYLGGRRKAIPGFQKNKDSSHSQHDWKQQDSTTNKQERLFQNNNSKQRHIKPWRPKRANTTQTSTIQLHSTTWPPPPTWNKEETSKPNKQINNKNKQKKSRKYYFLLLSTEWPLFQNNSNYQSRRAFPNKNK